jgi:hypothetical protein
MASPTRLTWALYNTESETARDCWAKAIERVATDPIAHVDVRSGLDDRRAPVVAPGRHMVLTGSMPGPQPIAYVELTINDWGLIGNFMYRPSVLETSVSQVR